MNDDEKRRLARMIAPQLAWDLSRSELLEFKSGESGTAAQIFVEQVAAILCAKTREGKSFSVAIIPHREREDG